MFGADGVNGAVASYPAPPARMHGMLLNDDRPISRKSAARWAAVEQRLSAASMVVGFVLFVLSAHYFSHFTQASGQLLGGIMLASGAAGVWGGHKRSTNAVNLQLVGCVLGIMLGFALVSEVVRDTQVDCALAELFITSKKTQAAVAEVAQQEAMQSVVMRLNEMEDSLTLVQTAAAKQVELRQEQQRLKSNDLAYIKVKLDMVRSHAQELLDSVLKNPNVTVDNIQRLSEDEKVMLRKRMETADAVIDRIAKHHEGGGGEVTFAEYQELLAALESSTDTGEAHPEVALAKAELPHFKAALERSKADVYDQLHIGGAPRQLEAIAQRRREQRERWNTAFEETLAKQEAKGTDFLVDLPAHCVQETAGERLMVAVGLASIVLQLVIAYVALSLSFRLPAPGTKSL